MDENSIPYILKQFPKLVECIKTLKDLSEGRKKRLEDALDALKTAAHETRRYYAAQENGKGIDKEKENELSYLWMTVSERFDHFDHDLAHRFGLKRYYWLSPESWEDHEIRAAGIGLNDITHEAETLLKSKRR